MTELPGWSENARGDLLHEGGSFRVVMTGPTGRWVAQRREDSKWRSLRKPGARRASYFSTPEKAVALTEQLFFGSEITSSPEVEVEP